jgi:hypothetical protein
MGLTGKINQPIIQLALCDMTLLNNINSGKNVCRAKQAAIS